MTSPSKARMATPFVQRAADALAHFELENTDSARRNISHVVLAFALDVDDLARVDAEITRCSWSIPQDGHPYNESCLYKRDRVDGQVAHGACWDMPYARATALRAAVLG